MNPPIRALTLDLDETLWAIGPVIARAEAKLHQWLQQHAPATAAAFDVPALQRERDRVAAEFPERAHDFTWVRLQSIAQCLAQSGEDSSLAQAAFDEFLVWRHRVELFPDARLALQRLAARYPLFALTNGNADLGRIGIDEFFSGRLAARDFGRGKPHADFFHAACAQLGLPPGEVLHVGDDWALDIEGAHAAGQPSAWIHRPGHPARPSHSTAQPAFVGSDLLQLLSWLEAGA
ncbi:putative hydrolase of the HAD superfamily [Inhella inkyongensis]|uniref:Putative hydrolase of the HAD superfamily n=1 Tax=Inhella inkyongensis TaxID=392593 RepID=A0A840RWE9_9BURK|nr:HAD-IA family hydrolase [Inhella inkyongensis]MBB5203017.1 putative hydrolase of the HAD superfamily [Inhella inkyongensis]